MNKDELTKRQWRVLAADAKNEAACLYTWVGKTVQDLNFYQDVDLSRANKRIKENLAKAEEHLLLAELYAETGRVNP